MIKHARRQKSHRSLGYGIKERESENERVSE